MQKRIIAVNDISCFGKCSITVALPIISASGIEATIIPTSVLSTHTGFKNPVINDLSNELIPIAKHLKSVGVSADAIYSGYLCSENQVNSLIEIIKLFKSSETKIIVDTVMGDNGVLYKGFSKDFPLVMLKLAKLSDIITPNITEACLMTNIEYQKPPYNKKYIENLINKLYSLTNSVIVLTGVCFDDKNIGATVFDGKSTEYIMSEKLPSSYHGTGDIFASTFVSSYVLGKDLKKSTEISVNFVCECIKNTIKNNVNPKNGVCFEECIPQLIKLQNEM